MPKKEFLEQKIFTPPPLRPRGKRVRAKEIEKGLREIYQNPEVKTDDLGVFEKSSGGGKRLLIAAVFFFAFLAAAAWAGFFIFRPAEKFAGNNIDFTIDAPKALTSGGEEELVIRYKNNENVPLGEVEITSAFSKDFLVTAREPEIPESASWKIGSLPKGGEGKITIRGKILAPKGKEITLQAYFSYRPANFNSDFQKVATLTVPVTESVLGCSLEGAEKVLPGEQTQYVIRYENKGSAEIAGVEIRAEYAENFFVSEAKPVPQEGGGRWILPKLKPGEKGEISVSGSFSSTAEGDRETSIEIGTVGADGKWLPQERASATVVLAKSELRLLLIANGQPKSGVINFGETMRYSLTYQNKSEAVLSDIVLTMHLSGYPAVSGKTPLLWETLADESGAKRSGTDLIWSKREIPGLARLEPGAESTIDFSIDTMAKPFAKSSADYSVQAYAEAKVGRVDGVKAERVARSETLESKFLSDLSFKSEARYFNDDDMALGTGPVPPKVGERTTYSVWWTINNTLHEIVAVKVASVLPDGVVFTGKFSSGETGHITYDADARKVTWLIDKVPADSNELRAEFEVAITPAEDQVGSVVMLTDIANFEGHDQTVDALVFRTTQALTTDIETDPNLAGRGTVRR